MALITINGTRTNVTATAADVSAVTNLDQLSDVNVQNGLADNELLQYNYSAGVWENTHEPVLETIAQTISGTTLKQTQSGFENKLRLQVYDNTSVGGDVLSGLQVSGREDDGSGGDTFHTLLSVLRTDVGGGDRGGFMYLVGDVTEFTSQDELGNSTPFAFNVSRVLSPSADNFLWDDQTAQWNIHGAESGSFNGNLKTGRDALLQQWDGLYDVGTVNATLGIAENGEILLNTNNNKISMSAPGRTLIDRVTDDWAPSVLKLTKTSTDSQLDIPLTYAMNVDGDQEYAIAKTAAYRHAIDDNRLYAYVYSHDDGQFTEAYRIREDAGELTMRIQAKTYINDQAHILSTDGTGLVVSRDSTDNTDNIGIEFAHDDTDNDIYTNLGRIEIGSEATDERSLRIALYNDDKSANHSIIRGEHDFAADTGRVNINAHLKVSLADATQDSSTMEINTTMKTESNHDAINNLAELESQTLSGDYKQNFNFTFRGDNVPTGEYKVGRIESVYSHGDELSSGVRLMAETSSQDGLNEFNVFNKYVETNAPFRLANIASGGTNPATPVEGDYFFNTTGPDLVRYNGTSWTALTDTGLSFYDSTNNRLTVREGGNWVYYSGTVI